MTALIKITPDSTPLHLRDALRLQCMDIHMQVEEAVTAGAYFASLEGYRRWLGIMRQVHAEFAHACDTGSEALGLEPVSGALLQALKADLGGGLCPVGKARTHKSAAIGVAYVFEGSAMGARLLQRRIADLEGAPTAYLDLLVTLSRLRWPATQGALAMYPGPQEAVVAGALEVFERLHQLFTDGRPGNA